MVEYLIIIIIIIAIVIYSTPVVTTRSIQGSRGFINHRGYQLLAAGLIEDEDHADKPDVCHEVRLLLRGLYSIIIALIIIFVSIYLGCYLGAPEEEVLLDSALLGYQGGEICPEPNYRQVLKIHS